MGESVMLKQGAWYFCNHPYIRSRVYIYQIASIEDDLLLAAYYGNWSRRDLYMVDFSMYLPEIVQLQVENDFVYPIRTDSIFSDNFRLRMEPFSPVVYNNPALYERSLFDEGL